MKMRTRTLMLSGLLLAAIVPARGEIQVAASKNQRFQSPMVLTLDFPVTDSSRWGQGEWLRGADYAALPGYVCDDVSIKNMEVSFEPSKNGTVRVNLKGIIAAAEGHDKAVVLNLDLLNSDIIVGSAQDDIEVEEEDEKKWKASMEVSPLALNTAPGPQLRISMTVEDD